MTKTQFGFTKGEGGGRTREAIRNDYRMKYSLLIRS